MTILLIAGAVVVVWAVFTFNRLIRLRQLGDNAWSDIDVQLKRRHDLIPNIVAAVQGHAGYERSTLEALVAARGRAVQAADRGPATRAREEDPLGGALQRVVAVAEAYPDLKANQNFLALQEELTGTESKIAYARQFYNDQVMRLNTLIQSFPSNAVARIFGFTARPFFDIDDPVRGPVKVDL